MPITMNHFKCSNGHTFEANAKLRTRCPECGIATKRSFEAVVKHDDPPKVDDKSHETPKLKTGPVLIRQGRPRMALKKSTPKPKLPTKPIGSKVVSAGLVKSRTIKTRGVMPTIKKRPVKTAVARTVSGHEQITPYWHEVARKYGF